MNENRLLIVGSFPKHNNNIIGGIRTSCDLLMQYGFKKNFIVRTLDSTQISNPPPHLTLRAFFAIWRLIRFTFEIIFQRPNTILIFLSDGPSAIEKSIMAAIAKILFINVILFPRAGNLINQTNRSKLFKYFIKSCFRKSDILLSQGETWTEYFETDLLVSKSRIVSLFNWTATNEILAIGAKRDLDNFKNRLVFTGWVEEAKGINELLLAINELIKDGMHLELDIVGNGALMSHVKNFINANNLNKVINLHGWLHKEQLTDLLSVNDIFILPSWHEGFPNSIIEAMSAKLAILTTNVGTICDHLINYESAIISQPKDYKQLKRNIELLLTDNQLRKDISNNAYEYALANFSTKQNIVQLEDILLSLNNS